MRRRDKVILDKVLSEIVVAQSMTSGCDFPSFKENEMLKRAVCMTVINIGELVKNLSEECRALDRSIPWRAIAGFRDIVAHKYQTLKMEDVFHTVTEDFPVLFRSIQDLIEKNDEEEFPL